MSLAKTGKQKIINKTLNKKIKNQKKWNKK